MENMSHPILAARELNILRLAAEGDSRGQSERAEDIARQVAGVREVKNNIVVKTGN